MKIITGVLLTVVIGLVGIMMFVMSGVMDVGAAHDDPAAIGWILEKVRENSIEKRAAQIVVPDITGESRMLEGASAYDEMCAKCHGAPGRPPFVGAVDMNPKPPQLADIADERKPGELFWVMKNGIRMTGMPAWGQTHSDEELWDLVAFVSRLPALSQDEYREALARAGNEHNAHSHTHGAGYEDAHDHHAGETEGAEAGHAQ